MHDGALAFHTVTEDDAVAIPRTRTDRLVMHVHHEGVWHRMFPDRSRTACGQRFHFGTGSLRPEQLNGEPICEECFHVAERNENDVQARAKGFKP